ncbi:MAG: efflux RND transporter periplasmic adaptor subunit [Deltaproteobacteria bacterium]|nr:efflux RND transporter periplasmic adaptor subunit [Deltaproteobacteria bacterium]
MSVRIAVAAVPALACAAALASAAACGDRKPPDPVVRPVRVAAAAPAPGAGQSRYSGNVEPAVRVDLAFKAGGYIAEIMEVRLPDGTRRLVQEGDRVRRGDVLARVRDQDYRVKLEQALAAIGQAEAAVDYARRDYDRAKPLREGAAIPQSMLDGAKAKLDGSLAARDLARAMAAEARNWLEDTAVRAPIDGTVMKRLVEVGSLVGPGSPGFVVADTDAVRVVFGVPDAALPRFAIGTEVSVRVDSIGLDEKGRVTAVSAFADPRTRVFDTEVRVGNGDGRMKPGMIASVAGEAAVAAPAPSVPLAAIVRPPGSVDGYAVFVVEEREGRTAAGVRRVVPGDVRGDRIEVSSGLAAGERVVVSGASFLADGEAVAVVQ